MNIVQAVISVALLATVTMGGVQYINADTQNRVNIGTRAEAGFQVLDSAFRARQAAGLSAPAAATWEADLFPTYGTKPNPVKGLTWSYGVDGSGTWFCLSGTPEGQVVRDALDRLTTRFPAGLYAVSEACGGIPGDAGPIAATYWVIKASS